MARKTAVVEKLEAQLAKWSTKIADLEAKAEALGAHARERATEQAKALRVQEVAARKRLEELRAAGEDAWHEAKSKAEQAWIELRDSIQKRVHEIGGENPAATRVAGWMTRDVATCRSTDSLGAAAKIMWERDCGCVPVTDAESRPVGVVTDRDLAIAAYFQNRPLGELRVESCMSRTVHACRETDDVAAAFAAMREHRVRRVPVVDDAGRLRGVLAFADLVREVERGRRSSKRRTGDGEELVRTLAAISEPRTAGSRAA